MPTLLSSTLNRRIVFPIRLLDQGQTVADLQHALGLLEIGLGEREVKEKRFGRMTRQAVIAFQRRQNLQPTGQIDEATANRLNELLTRQGLLPAKSRPFRDRNFLRLKLRETGRLDNEARAFVRQRLNAELKEAILRQFNQPSEALQAAVRTMDLDYETMIAEPLNVVLRDRVVSTLLDRPELEEEIEKQTDRGFSRSNKTVAELLSLDSDFRLHPLFREEARRAKAAAIGRIVKLEAPKIEAIEELDLDVVGAETWARLVATGVLNERTRQELENTVELAKLADDKFEVIEALRAERRASPRDLIPLDKPDWQNFLARHQITPPEDDDLETYAALLNQNVQRTFRTPYLMHRLVERRRDDVLSLTADLEPLLARNEVIFVNGSIREDLDWGEITGDKRNRLEANVREMNRFANTYRHLGIAGILNDRALTGQEKQRAIRVKQTALQTFHRNNPDLDLEWLNVFNINSRLGRAFQPKWDNISEEDRPQLRRTMMAFQRTQRLTENFDESEALLASGLDSATAILKLPEAEFARRVNLDDAVARRIYRKAADTAVFTGHALSVIEESTTHARFQPAVLKEGADTPNLEIVNVLKDIDGYQDLFGNQNYCHCKHCRSIFSPAAYFVDLMDFVHGNVSQPTFISPKRIGHPLYLKNRRPDLWTLALTCENTDTLVPYLTIVNEVLERYLEKAFEEDDIYQALTEAHLSFRQPFNLPFESSKLYLSHFRVSLPELYELFSLRAADMARARLGCAPEELNTIVTPDIERILLRYSFPSDTSALDVQTILSHAGISREELDRLLKLDFIRGGLEIGIEVDTPEDDLIGFTETMRVRSAPNGKALSAENALVRHLLDRLHRFIRLWRLLPWNPEELHIVMTSLMDSRKLSDGPGGPTLKAAEELREPLDEEMVISIANLRLIQESFELPVEELYALYHQIPTLSLQPEKPSLHTRLFGELETLRIQHPSLNNTDPGNPVVSPDFGLLQGALRLPESQVVELILMTLATQAIQNATLNRQHLSLLYRQARLARLLGMSLQDFARVQELLDMPTAVKQPKQRIEQLLSLVCFKRGLYQAPFSVSEVWWLLKGEPSGNTGPHVDQTQVDALLEESRSDPMLSFTPDSLVEVEGVSLTQAQALLGDHLAQAPLNWVARVDEGQERYRLTPAYGRNPDIDPVVAFFINAGDSSDVAKKKGDGIRQKLNGHHPHTILIGHLTEQFNINQAYFEALQPFLTIDSAGATFITLLFTWLEPANETSTQVLLDLMQALERLVYLFQEKLELSAHSLNFIASSPDSFALSLPFALRWASLRLLSAYSDFLPGAATEPKDLHQVLESWTGAEFPEAARPQLVVLLKTDLAQLQALLDTISLPDTALDALVALKDALKLTLDIGLNGAALKQLTAKDYAGLKAANKLVYGAIRSKYGEKEWAEVIEAYEDKLNMIKRDALVDRILSKEFQLKFKDARELYQFFLLDMEMDGCARTSRVLEAISACQLYVHRCRMNLEQSESGDAHVLPDSIPEDQWLWRKNYRVWEANRKIFLYPENWLEPDLRDNKTPIFKQVESELLQSTITPEAIEKIYRNYLREYAELSKLIVVSALYDDNEDAYVFFARTQEKPYQYYWRKLLRNVEWTPWWKIELEIEPAVVSAHKHRGKLYLFWIRVLTNNDKDQARSESIFIEDNQTIYLEYSFLELNGRWTTPQRVPFHAISVFNFDDKFSGNLETLPQVNPDNVAGSFPGFSKKRLRGRFRYGKVYVDTIPNENQMRVVHSYSQDQPDIAARLNEYTTSLEKDGDYGSLKSSDFLKIGRTPHHVGLNKVIFVTLITTISFSGEAGYEATLSGNVDSDARIVTNVFPSSLGARLSVVHNSVNDFVLSIDNQQFFIRYLGGEGYLKVRGNPMSPQERALYPIAYSLRKRDTIRLGTTLAEELGEILFNRGLERFLRLETQELDEARIRDVSFEWISELMPPTDTNTKKLNFRGAQGPYFQEMFFHLPFLIAHYLNASQKFADADYWYRRIFDPTANENPEPPNRTDRNWRYIEFRNRHVPRLREILTDEDAIERYKEDPFNPFAIARLRTLAFQKAVVMKYVDNLLDWGDHLFAQDTVESINEATMLYIMAADILGDRPLEVGDCETTTEFLLTYQNILSHQRSGSEFLVELENLQVVMMYLNAEALELLGDGGEPKDPENISAGFVALRSRNVRPKEYSLIKTLTKRQAPESTTLARQYKVAAKASADTAAHRSLAFCIPPNDKLLSYWDRVGDRLYKIRNCMNLQGVRRQLALFQPPIEPGLLVKAKAAGLSLEEALGLLAAEAPAYRFAYLLEKAKQFAGTVQSFGNSLLSALEKKDTEELALLRAVHEQELLNAVRQVKEAAKTEATHNKSSLEQGKTLASQRKTYYASLLTQAADPELAISKNEQDSLDKQEDAKENEKKASGIEHGVSAIHAGPTIEFDIIPIKIGLPFHPMAETPAKSDITPLSITHGTSNVAAALSAIANKFRRDTSFKHIESSRAATRGGHERRKQEWTHQKELAEQEERQFDKQILAADLRIQLTEKDLAAHDKQAEQSVEIHEFYKDKFTNLGLYTYLATSLSRLYREAYNLAHDMAMKAQQAYQFETDDQTFFIASDNWEADKAGLLASERLTLQLQRMEKAHLDQNRREYEITLPCSLAQINPRALIDLRETGRCDFSVPEIWFDLYYPGQYKRRIKSARLTIPCVTGPYANVSAKLTLTGSRIRPKAQLNSELVGVTHQRNTSVGTSTANNDAGVFELNFRDERYVPFEGAGAVSEWSLELPSVIRPFDYDTISDVILHISYTARDDGRFRAEVEDDLAHRFEAQATESALRRGFSMKREFPNELHRLIFPPQGQNQTTELRMSKRYFPYFVKDRELTVNQVEVFLKPKDGETVDLNNLRLEINQTTGPSFSNHAEVGLPFSRFAFTEPISREESIWRLEVPSGSLTADTIEDLYLLVTYQVGAAP
jgi:hypothetical protein